jgi:hypothetical protein
VLSAPTYATALARMSDATSGSTTPNAAASSSMSSSTFLPPSSSSLSTAAAAVAAGAVAGHGHGSSSSAQLYHRVPPGSVRKTARPSSLSQDAVQTRERAQKKVTLENSAGTGDGGLLSPGLLSPGLPLFTPTDQPLVHRWFRW